MCKEKTGWRAFLEQKVLRHGPANGWRKAIDGRLEYTTQAVRGESENSFLQ